MYLSLSVSIVLLCAKIIIKNEFSAEKAVTLTFVLDYFIFNYGDWGQMFLNLFFLFYSNFSFWLLATVFILNLLLLIYRPLFLSLLFVAQKVTKRHSTDKISRIALLLTNFREQKYPSVGRYLSATFPAERLRGSVKVKLRHGAQENFHTLFRAFYCGRCLWFWQCCIFLKVTFAVYNAMHR